jgi:hypothetical protein
VFFIFYAMYSFFTPCSSYLVGWLSLFFQFPVCISHPNISHTPSQSCLTWMNHWYLKIYVSLWVPGAHSCIILATQEAEIRRIAVWSQPGQTDPISKTPNTKKGLWSGSDKKQKTVSQEDDVHSSLVPFLSSTQIPPTNKLVLLLLASLSCHDKIPQIG